MNPALRFHATAASRAEAVALRLDGAAWRFGELADLASRLAAALHGAGIRRGDLVVSRFATPASELAAFFALMHVGAVHCSIAHLGGAEIEVAPIAVLSDAQTLPALRDALPDSRAIDIDAVPSSGRDAPDFAPAAPDDVSQLILTSGTTGRAKMVKLTHGAIAARTAIRSGYFPTPGGVLLLMGPMTAGGCQTALSTLLAGHTLDLSRDPDGLVRAVRASGIDHVIASPVQLSGLLALLGRDGPAPGTLSGILLMGAAASASLIEAARRIFDCPITVMYGTSEVGACATVTLDATRPADAGQLTPLAGVRIEVVDDAGQPLPPGATGHVRIATPGMAAGYFADEPLSREHFRGEWFHPGDLGQLQGDGLVLAGRCDEMVNIGGVKFDPAEIDRMIEERRLAGDAAAFRFVDGSGVERLMVAAVTDSQHQFDRLRAEVAAYVAGRVPLGHFRIDRIPRNEMGKPLRQVLAEAVKRRLSVPG